MPPAISLAPRGEDVDWWRELRLDLDREPSGIASAVFEATAMTVYDTTSSGVVSRRLADAVGAKSAAFVPLLVEERVTAVISVATLDEPRVFSSDELAVMQTLAAEAAVALERLRAEVALEEALKRNEEQLAQQSALLRAAHVLSSELDLPVVLQRLADQLAQLLDADAADCYLLDRERGMFRCVAVHGFDTSLLSFEFPMGQGLAGAAVREGRPLIESAYGEIAAPVPHPAYDGLHRRDHGADVLERRGARGARRRPARGAPLHESGRGHPPGLCRPRVARAAKRRDVHAERPAGTDPAGLLPDRVGARAVPVPLRDARGGRPGCRGGARWDLGRGARAVERAARGGRRVRASGRPREILAERAWGSQSPLFRAALEGRIVVSSSIADDERLLPDLRGAAAANRYLSLISVPVDAPRDAGRGLVLIFFAEERSFSDDDLELARHLADATRGALERSELFEAERGARALAQQLTRTGRLLTSELDPAAVLDEVVQQAPALVNAEAGAFRLLDGEELVVTAADGEGAEAALGSRSPAGGWLSGDVLQSGTPVALAQAGDDERLRSLDPMLQAGHAAFLGVPVGGAEGANLGVLAVYAAVPRQWREEEIEALLAVAASTSAALANAELYQRVALERERSVAILANIAEGIVAVDRDGKVVLWNSAAEVITGVPASVALGRAPVDVLQRSLESPEGGRAATGSSRSSAGARRSGCRSPRP